jgi:hypothetical protein
MVLKAPAFALRFTTSLEPRDLTLHHAYGDLRHQHLGLSLFPSFLSSVSVWVGFLSVQHFPSSTMKIPRTSLPTRSTSIQELDQGNAVRIASCIILSVTVVIFIARQVMKAVVFRRAALDDLFIFCALVGIPTTAPCYC